MNPECDARGVIIGPDFHDGKLMGMRLYTADKSLILYCRTVDEKDYELTIPKVVRLVANDFREGNIIFEATLCEGTKVPEHAVKELWQYNAAMRKKHLDIQMQQIHSGRWTLLRIESSYGCKLLVLSQESAAHISVDPSVKQTLGTRKRGMTSQRHSFARIGPSSARAD